MFTEADTSINEMFRINFDQVISETLGDTAVDSSVAIVELNPIVTRSEQEDVLPDVVDRKPRPFETEIPQPEGDMN
jgi:hypothetical protein